MDLLSFDPGMNGAWSGFEDGELMRVENLPVIDGAIDSKLLRLVILGSGKKIIVAVEHFHHIAKRKDQRGIDVQYMNYGRLLSQIETCPNVIEIIHVVPKSWHATSGITPGLTYDQRKAESIAKAVEFWSDKRALFLKDKSAVTYDDNKAESALIGRHVLIKAEDKKSGRRPKRA